MKAQTIKSSVLDQILSVNKSDTYYWDRNRIYVDGVLHWRDTIAQEVTQKSTCGSLIKKEPYFSYGFMETVYQMIEPTDDAPYAITYARPTSKGRFNHGYRYELDLFAAYTHVLKFEKLPIDGNLYDEPKADAMNFYRYHGDKIKNGCVITDDLAAYLGYEGCTYMFGTDYIVGSKMGDKLYDKAHKTQETKQEIKGLHYGYWQKRYIDYDATEDCYIRNKANCHELLMVAVLSQLTLIMLQLREAIGIDNGVIVTDAYKWDSNAVDIDKIKDHMQKNWGHYHYRIKDNGQIIYQTYKELPCRRAFSCKSTKGRQKVCANCTLKVNCKYGTILLQG